MKDSVFKGHNSSMGVLLVHNASSLDIVNSIISQNTAMSSGFAAVTIFESSHANILNTKFIGNSALAAGAVKVDVNSQVKLANCTISSNKAALGGALAITENTTLELIGSTFEENQALFYPKYPQSSGSGGAMYFSYVGKILIERTSFIRNRASVTGGVMRAQHVTHLIVRNCTFVNNTAEGLGAPAHVVPPRKRNLTIAYNGQTIKTNPQELKNQKLPQTLATDRGKKFAAVGKSAAGVIFGNYNVSLEVHETKFTGNKADEGGSINLQIQSKLYATNCMFDSNSATYTGGTVVGALEVILEINNTTFIHNMANHSGGAVYVTGNTVVKAQNTSFMENRADYGGAIVVDHDSHLTLTNCLLNHNLASLRGGAINILSNSSSEMANTSFIGNSAYQAGAVNVDGQSHLTLTDCVLNNNSVTGSAGAVRIFNGSSDMKSTDFTANTARNQGGGIDAFYDSYLYIEDCVFLNNSADNKAGALSVHSRTTVEINNASIIQNSVTDFAGAVGAFASATLIFRDTNFTNNTGKLGGAIGMQQTSDVYLINCLFQGNHGWSQSGAIFAGLNSTLKIDKCSFIGNSAVEDGGAITVRNSKCDIQHSEFQNNKAQTRAAALALLVGSSVDIRDTNLTRNTAAICAAIYVEGTFLHMENNRFLNNTAGTKAGALCAIDLQKGQFHNCEFQFNKANEGGAVYFTGSNTFISDSKFSYNIATDEGGAIMLDKSNSSMNNVTVTNNRAHFSSAFNLMYSKLKVKNSIISYNYGRIRGAAVTMQYSRLQVGV